MRCTTSPASERAGYSSGRRRLDERVGETHFDERLPGDAEPAGFLVDLAEQVDGEIHVDALDRLAGAAGLAAVHVRGEVHAGVVHGVEFHGYHRAQFEISSRVG